MWIALVALALVATDPNAVVARVGPDVITGGEVVARAHALHVRPSAALENLVDEALVASLARSAGLASDPDVQARLEAERRRAAVDQLLQEEVFSKVKVSEADVANAFHARQDQVRISMVVRANEQEAHETLARLRAGAGIIEEARSSIDPVGRAKSGVMGWFQRDQIAPALAQAAFAAPLGEPGGPVRVKKGWAVFVVHARRVGDEATLQGERAAIRRELERSRRDEQTRQLIGALRRRSRASVDAAFLRSTGGGLAGTTQLARPVATVGVKTITYGDVVAQLRAETGATPSRADTSPDAKERIAWRLVDGLLLEREAMSRNLRRRAVTTAALRGTTRAVLAHAFAQHVAAKLPAPPRADVEARYARRTDDYWVPSHRLCSVLDARDEAHAKQIRSRLLEGEPVERVAREYVDPASPHALEPVRFTDAELDEMSTPQGDQHMLAWVIRKAKPGEWATVENRGHWHVVRCDAQRPARRQTLAEVRDEIAATIRQEQTAKAIDERVAELRRVTRIRTYPTALTDEAQ